MVIWTGTIRSGSVSVLNEGLGIAFSLILIAAMKFGPLHITMQYMDDLGGT
mgnify:CR=1 FL=1